MSMPRPLRPRTADAARFLACLALWAPASGCDNSSRANISGEIGWVFNYRDWSKPLCGCAELAEADCDADTACRWNATATPASCEEVAPAACTVDDLRDCGNQPDDLAGDAPYPEVTTLHVYIEEADAAQPTLDTEFDCDVGDAEDFLGLQGQPGVPLRMILTASAEDGTTLYVTESPFEIDLSVPDFKERFELRTPNGDLAFAVDYPESGVACAADADCSGGEICCIGGGCTAGTCDLPVGLCPLVGAQPGVESLRYTLTREDETEPTLVGTLAPACEATGPFGTTAANELFIRNIPSSPSASSGGGFLPEKYTVQIEALDASSEVTYCGSSLRNVSPGRNRDNSSQSLETGPCP